MMADKNTIDHERYRRQLILDRFGETAQRKLSEARVLVIGAGGLGSPVLLYLAAAGVETIGIADDDTVALDNLHRQVLFNTDDIGYPKTERAARTLRALNPEIKILTHNIRITNKNALEIFEGYDLVVDGSDNFPTRYLVNDACVLLRKPLVFGAVSRYEGQVGIFDAKPAAIGIPVNYRDLFPEPAGVDKVLNCEETGVLGVTTGIIGTMMANETVKLITGTGKALVNRVLTFSTFNNSFYEIEIDALESTGSSMPRNKVEYLNTDYVWLCSSHAVNYLEIDAEEFDKILTRTDVRIIDVREPGELPEVTEFPNTRIPAGELDKNREKIEEKTVILFCQSGLRSLIAARILADAFGNSKKIFSLKGGILEWKHKHDLRYHGK